MAPAAPTRCIFCTASCPPSFAVIDGKFVKLKREEDDATEPGVGGSGIFGTSTGGTGENEESDDLNWSIEGQLKVVFVLRKILNVGKKTCSKFLSCWEGQLHPEFWLVVCSSCDVFVQEAYQTLREIGRLERKVKGISGELKGFMRNTRGFKASEDDAVGSVWDKIREQVFAG